MKCRTAARPGERGSALRSATRQGREGGFTLFEMLIVIMIIVLVAGTSIATLNTFFRGQEVKQGAGLVSQAFTRCKQLASTERRVHFMVFDNVGDAGRIQTFVDANSNHVYDPKTDKEIPGAPVDLPRFVKFAESPKWIGIEPNGYCVFNAGFREVSSGDFEGEIAAGRPVGDIILQLEGRPYKMCMDVERASGKLRKSHFFAE